MSTFSAPEIPNLVNSKLAEKLQFILDNKTKPIGALGKLEALAVKIGLIQSSTRPRIERPQIRVFAADHGLAKHGTSAFPSEVTAQMVLNFINGGAAINVLARQHNIELKVVDAGVATDFIQLGIEQHTSLLNHKIRFGSRDALNEAAMSESECIQALNSGMQIAKQLEGNLLICGEMGIGNTSAASLLLAKLSGIPIADCIGRGTGLDDSGFARKLQILNQVLQRHEKVEEPIEVLAAVGGLEIAMMAGAYIQAAHDRRILLIDGFIASSALLIAEKLAPGVTQFAIFAHHSEEPGHKHLLQTLAAEPLLDFGMRLGEGSGAALAYPLLQSACAIINEMASFDEAAVSKSNGLK